MVQTNETLHVCVYYPEHKPMAKRIYGKDRVDEQLKEEIDYCNDCRMLQDLCKYVGINKVAPIKIENDYEIDYQKSPIRDRNNHIVGVKTELVYRETLLTIDEFFEPPGNGKKWIDLL